MGKGIFVVGSSQLCQRETSSTGSSPWARIRSFFLLIPFLLGTGLLAASKEAWVEVRSPHFIAYSDAGVAEAKRALEGFEAIRTVFGMVIPRIRVDAGKPMVVLVLENEASMKRFVPDQFEGKDSTRPSGLYLQGSDRNYAILRLDVSHQADQPYFSLFHEYTHSIVHLNFPGLPTWLDEGLADFYGATEIHSNYVNVGRVPIGRLATFRRGRMPLEALLKVTHESQEYNEGNQAGMFYAQSWAMVHYLFMEESARKAGAFQAYLKSLSHEGDPLDHAREGFGDLRKMEDSLARYAQRPMFTTMRYALTVQLTDKDFQTRPLTEAEALVARADFLLHFRKGKEAQPLLSQALTLDPKSPSVQAALGFGYLSQGEQEPAQKALLAAFDAGSQDFRVPYHLALIAQNEGQNQIGGSAKILGWLEAARKLQPGFAGVHMAFCRQFATNPRDPVKSLQEGVEAVTLEPQNLMNRINFGFACMELGLESEARTLGGQVEKLAVSAVEKDWARTYSSALAQFVGQRRHRQEESEIAESESRENVALNGAKKVKPKLQFNLPSNLTALGHEVQRLVLIGNLDEAIRKVDEAHGRVKSEYERKSLKALADRLRAQKADE